jgi:hypothetical protein
MYIILQGSCLFLGSIGLTIGSGLITSPEVSLYTLFETVLGPLWVWLGGYEHPSLYAFCGGAALIIALAVHRYVDDHDADEIFKIRSFALLVLQCTCEFVISDNILLWYHIGTYCVYSGMYARKQIETFR